MDARAFTLVEFLVVVSIIALLIALLLPSLTRAKQQARIVRVHAELRQITTALDAYAMDSADHYPPSRSGCGTSVLNQLPVELATDRYLPRARGAIPQAEFADLFDPSHTYKYRAPGAIWFNGTYFDDPKSTWRPRSKIWVPDDFPHCASPNGRYYANLDGQPRSPVAYAVWSVGPKPTSRKLPRHEGTDVIDESTFPLPRALWLKDSRDDGLITHYRSTRGLIHMSP